MFLKQVHHKQRGFTLLELLVVVALLGFLVAVAIPNVLGFISKGDNTAALEEQHNLLVAISAALNWNALNTGDSPPEVFQDYFNEKIPSDPGSVNRDEVAKYLDKTTRFNWSISKYGILSPGSTNNPLYKE